MSRVLVVEDEAAIAELIALNLRHAGFEVVVAHDANDAQDELDKVLPDLVLLDWMLPGQSGLALAKRWRGASPTHELMARVRAVLRRKAPQALDAAVEVAGLRLDPATRRVNRGDLEVKIGPTEFKLLHFFMTHPERVHSRAQLLDRVWGDHVFIEERTVDVHVKRLREALTPVQRAMLIETVRGAGYRLTQQVADAA
jgi:two-component system phosphate regulon response regulator PhoB